MTFLKEHQEELFILGFPLETSTCKIKQIKVKEYPTMSVEIAVLKMAEWEVKGMLRKEIKGHPLEQRIKEDLKRFSLIECIQLNILGLRKRYAKLFDSFLIDFEGEKFFEMFDNQDQFDEFRYKILDFNGIDYIIWEKNKELRKFQRLELYYNQVMGKSADFDSMFTSLMVIGHKPHDINDFTLRQFYSAFKRLQFFKGYDTSVLFKTVDTKGKVDVIEWYRSSKDVGQAKDAGEIMNEFYSDSSTPNNK